MLKKLSGFVGEVQLFLGVLAFFVFQFGIEELEILFSFQNNFFIQTGMGVVSAIFILSGLVLLI